MVTEEIRCYHCESENLVKNGIAPNGKQKFRCRDCGKQSRKQPSLNGYPEARKEEIMRAYEERSSLRGLSRTFGVSRNTVSRWLKKNDGASSP
jgi:transposase-like protein